MLVSLMLFSALLEVSLLSSDPQKFFATLQNLFSFGWWFRKPPSQAGRFLAAEVIKIIHISVNKRIIQRIVKRVRRRNDEDTYQQEEYQILDLKVAAPMGYLKKH